MRYFYGLVFGVISWVICTHLPFHQDEFLHFHSLAYGQAAFALNQFKEGFSAYEKFFPFGLSVYFPFLYTGNFQAVLFSPFYELMPILQAKMVYSLISLLLIYASILRFFRLDEFGKAFLFLFLPFYIAVLRDAGPVNFALLVFVLSGYLSEKISSNTRLKWVYALVLSLIWSLAFYDKIYFVYLMPSLLIFSVAHLPVSNWLKSTFLIPMGFAICLFGLFILTYSLSAIQIRQFQLPAPFDVQIPFFKAITAPDGIHWLEDRVVVMKTILAQFDFSFYLLRNLNYTDFLQAKVGGGLHWFGIGFICLLVLEFKHADRKAKWYLVSFVVMVLTFLVLGKIRFGHHTIFLAIPILGFWFDGRRPIVKKGLFLWLSVNVLVTCINISIARPHEALGSSYHELTVKTKLDRPVIVNFDSWNYYYLRNLDADHSLVTWVDLQDSIQTNRLFALAKRLHRPIVNVSGSPKVFRKNWFLIRNRVDSVCIDQTFPSNPIFTFRVKH
jgi:hypothetical protein